MTTEERDDFTDADCADYLDYQASIAGPFVSARLRKIAARLRARHDDHELIRRIRDERDALLNAHPTAAHPLIERLIVAEAKIIEQLQRDYVSAATDGNRQYEKRIEAEARLARITPDAERYEWLRGDYIKPNGTLRVTFDRLIPRGTIRDARRNAMAERAAGIRGRHR